MRSSWSEPYLWVHLAGLAVAPIFLELCLLGLASAGMKLPADLVLLFVAAVGIVPIFWMQWQRPFCIFSLLPLVLKPSELTERQRQILQQFKTPITKGITVVVAIGALAILWQLNQWVPLVSPAAKVVPGQAFGGLLLAAGAFLLSNLFLQVPASVLQVLLTPDAQLAKAEPYPVAQIPQDFTLIGLRVKQILPPVTQAPIPTGAATKSPAATNLASNLAAEPAVEEPVVEESALEEPVLNEPTEKPATNPEVTSEAPAIFSEPEIAEPISQELTSQEPISQESTSVIDSEQQDDEQQDETEWTDADLGTSVILEATIFEQFEIEQSDIEQSEIEEPEIEQSDIEQPEIEQLEAETTHTESINANEGFEAEATKVDKWFEDDIDVDAAHQPLTEPESQTPNVKDTVVTVIPTGEADLEDEQLEETNAAQQPIPTSEPQTPQVEDTVVTVIPSTEPNLEPDLKNEPQDDEF